MNRQIFIRALTAVAAGLVACAASAQGGGAVRIIVGYPAGATSDALTRVLAEHMAGTLKQTVIVENKVGAGGRIANELVKAAPADGTTLLMTPVATMAVFPHSYAGKLRYDPVKDFAPVAHLTNFQLGIGVASSVPAKTLAEYVTWVKSDPSKNGFYRLGRAGQHSALLRRDVRQVGGHEAHARAVQRYCGGDDGDRCGRGVGAVDRDGRHPVAGAGRPCALAGGGG